MKKFSFAGGMQCGACGAMTQIIYARSHDEVYAGLGLCEACFEKSLSQPGNVVMPNLGEAESGGEEESKPAGKRGRRGRVIESKEPAQSEVGSGETGAIQEASEEARPDDNAISFPEQS